MVEPVSNTPIVGNNIELLENNGSSGLSRFQPSSKDSIETKRSPPVSGFDYAKMVLWSALAIAFFTVVGLCVNLVSKDNGDIDAKIESYRKNIREAKEGKDLPSEEEDTPAAKV